ncbi:MAG: prolipoprotein diacylglyceryl transferase [Nitrospirae bacterium GWC2_57_13]|jgi:phosphatidylglycerol---prolipoprotein diacylglyceryl transferase|nr:MAG: prolipoprotein diacylglyceryl transferase [Nitrospirae bacterium GWC1_57_7]OGW28142.1 MAG: prolipoprotein diacylglyceryl transferase [Nitrospirae bacterium GWC2_57_13]OGW46585.1 MAG: prolipoprotein diacylglyceryl transferase [Nitrospirae bacterium GWD2_57_8]HAR46066.1 prolipoprotein diacylglyceryl transferase [Nitrospiraceae bacterium]HAS53731.1 prolipoprotein diacylglyceryl transferase [Nitrospiraceae bacterium]
MHPILFEIPEFFGIGPLPLRMYGLMIGIGFLLAITLASQRARKEGVSPDRILDMGVYLLLAAIIGSRVLYVLINLEEFSRNPLEVFAIWKGGLVFFGGLLAAVPVGIWYVKRHKLPVWKTADIMAPYIALGHAFGRLGCFFAGCCFGSPCDGPVCITFTDPHSLAPLGVPLWPTQLMESGGEFLIFGLLLLIRNRKSFDGQLFWLYPLLYSILRFIVEEFRGDTARGLYFGGLASTSQIIAVGLALVSVFMLWRMKSAHSRKAKRTS